MSTIMSPDVVSHSQQPHGQGGDGHSPTTTFLCRFYNPAVKGFLVVPMRVPVGTELQEAALMAEELGIDHNFSLDHITPA